MRVIISVLTAAGLGLVPALGAQQKTPAPRREPPPVRADGCVTSGDRTECRFSTRASIDSAMAKRAVLGVVLSPTGTKRDTLGVFVSRVTPKGPAENAGIVEGDRIVSINNIDLRVSSADAGDEYAAGLPQRRLTREVERLAPGNVVNLRVYSGGRTRDVQVPLGKASDFREMGFGGGEMFPGMAMGALRPGLDGMGMELRNLSRARTEDMQIPRMRMEEMNIPRMRMEEMQLPRIRMEELMPLMDHLRDNMRMEHLAPGRYELRGPNGVRVFDGENSWTMGGPDGVIVLRPDRAARDSAKVRYERERTKTESPKKK